MTKAAVLPSKESTLFKNALKFYENKAYKKGLKTADQILKKFPGHGETLAMKGLFCSHLPDRKEEAHDLIKKGIRADLTSHICWHVLGLYHRADRNYEEALKCYNQALKYDPSNSQIARDVAHMQIHTRNLPGFIETRLDILEARPNIKGNWISLALAYHLHGDYQLALDVLSSLQDNFKDEYNTKNFENSEFFLYKNWIMEELGNYDEALQDLETIRSLVVDSTAWLEAKARLFLKVGKKEYAEVQYHKLIALNAENIFYLDSLEASRGLDGDFSERRLNLYRDLIKKYPKSFAIKQRFLLYSSIDRFEEAVKDFLISSLQKGVPSLFVTTRDLLYKDAAKVQVIEKVLSSIINVLELDKKLSGQTELEAPTTILWAYYYMAQHLDWTKNHSEALKMIKKALDHTPTLLEAYMVKAKILKHSGSFQCASEEMDKARQLDLQDRFINSKCAKYMFRAGRIQDAEKTVCLFTKVGIKNPLQDLVDMQCSWFSIESGRAFARSNNPGRALKSFHQIEKTFGDINDDEFDFHTYSIRKLTLRSYKDLLKMSDNLRSHHFFRDAAILAVEIYLNLYDKPKESALNEDLESMSLSEKKKALRKAKKAELKNAENTSPFLDITDEDPLGLKLLEGDILMNAMTFVSPLLKFSPESIKALVLGAQIYMRRKKYILALKFLKKAKSLNSNDADVFKAIVDFNNLLKNTSDLSPLVKKVLDSEILLEETFFSDYIQSWTANAKTVHQLWISWHVLENLGMNDQSLLFLDKINATTPEMSHEILVLILDSLLKYPTLYDKMYALGKKIFPLSDIFCRDPIEIRTE